MPLRAHLLHCTLNKPLPSKEDWQHHQGRIRELYLVENKTLKDVMYTMEKDYGFKATIKMYKSRFTKWGFDQKYKKRDAPISQTTRTQARPFNDDARIPPRGRSTSFAKEQPCVTKVCARSSDSSVQEPTSPCLDVFVMTTDESWQPTSPKPQTSPSAKVSGKGLDSSSLALGPSMQSPANLETSADFQQFEREVCLYFRSSFYTGLWVDDGQDTPCRSAKGCDGFVNAISIVKNNLIEWLDVLWYSPHFLDDPRMHAQMTEMIISESPELLRELIELSLRMVRRKFQGECSRFLRQVVDVSAVFNAKGHAVYRLLSQYAELDSLEFEEILAKGWRLIVDQFSAHLGCLHITALTCRLGWLTYFASSSVCDEYICLTECDHGKYAENSFRELLESCECRRSKSAQTEMVLKALLSFLLKRHNYAAIHDIGQEVLLRSNANHGPGMLFLTLKALSQACFNQGKLDEAEKYARKLVDVSETTWGHSSPKTPVPTYPPERCLTRKGKFEEAQASARNATYSTFASLFALTGL